jgi:pilus assembly protein CpaB
MRNSRATFIGAFLLALVAGVAVYLYQTSADSRALAGKESATVLEAARDIPAGLSLADARAQGLLKVERFPVKALPSDVLTDAELNSGPSSGLNSGLTFGHAVGAGQLIRRADLTQLGTANPQIQVPDGEVAVAITVDDAARVAGFVSPGAEVAVYWTPADASAAQVLLPRVSVLAVGATSTSNAVGSSTSAAASGAGSGVANVNLVTLALRPNDAPRVVLASKTGSINLGLLGDGTVLQAGSGSTASTLMAGKP